MKRTARPCISKWLMALTRLCWLEKDAVKKLVFTSLQKVKEIDGRTNAETEKLMTRDNETEAKTETGKV